MEQKIIDLNEVIESARRLIARLLTEDISLVVNYCSAALSVFADEGQLHQVLMNLVANARDAMPDGGSLTLTTGKARIDEEFIAAHGYGRMGNYVFFSVADTGTGMAAETAQHIFDPFFTTKEQGKGTGLGLSIVYGIIKQHEGYIEVDSSHNSGTKFTVYLPENHSGALTENSDDLAVSSLCGEETILLVDDNSNVRSALASILRHHGYNVIETADGKSAVELFRASVAVIRLIILDLVMPGQSGKVTFHQLREIGAETPVIFLTGNSGTTSPGDEPADKYSVVLMKPIDHVNLTETIRKLLDSGQGGD
jgi:CheY-like chemotaxis protein